ncbi:MAG: LamG domain-containing protein [Bacteroidota bacterium]
MKFFLLIVIAALPFVNVAQTVPSYVPTNGLAGWWPFNGNANDESGNGNNGTVNGATLTNDRNGNVNCAYSLDGISNYISVISSPPLNLNSSFTISAWVYKNNNLPMAFVSKARLSNNTYSYHLSTGQSGSTLMSIAINNDPPTGGCNNCNIYCGSNNGDTLSWIHTVGTWDGTTLNFYANGLLTSSCNGTLGSTGTLISNNFDLLFGKFPDNVSYHNGKLDDIGIWTRALTQQEITNLYNGSVTTGLNNDFQNNELNIFPNPSDGKVNIV